MILNAAEMFILINIIIFSIAMIHEIRIMR